MTNTCNVYLRRTLRAVRRHDRVSLACALSSAAFSIPLLRLPIPIPGLHRGHAAARSAVLEFRASISSYCAPSRAPGSERNSRVMTEFAKEVLPVNIEDEMRTSYMEYAMSVIVGRALPDVRDGLKPVHRRVLFAMSELGNDWNKPYKKSARVVGDVIGKYHPHGDTAVYDTIVRMAQPFSLRYMLVDGQGNFGSVDGDAPAARRYTEVRMSRIAHELLADLDKETVDFAPNYDESEKEPVVFPAKIPNLLFNGAAGIAVGLATNVPPHNLNEVIDGCLAVIDNPAIDIPALMMLIPGPDFPTAAIINGARGIHEAYHAGRGRFFVWARSF